MFGEHPKRNQKKVQGLVGDYGLNPPTGKPERSNPAKVDWQKTKVEKAAWRN